MSNYYLGLASKIAEEGRKRHTNFLAEHPRCECPGCDQPTAEEGLTGTPLIRMEIPPHDQVRPKPLAMCQKHSDIHFALKTLGNSRRGRYFDFYLNLNYTPASLRPQADWERREVAQAIRILRKHGENVPQIPLDTPTHPR